jgi:hypothetical protein
VKPYSYSSFTTSCWLLLLLMMMMRKWRTTVRILRINIAGTRRTVAVAAAVPPRSHSSSACRYLRDSPPSRMISILSSSTVSSLSFSRSLSEHAAASAQNTATANTTNNNKRAMTPRTKSLFERLQQQHVLDKDDDDDATFWEHRKALAQAITLLESRLEADQEQANLLLTAMLRLTSMSSSPHSTHRNCPPPTNSSNNNSKPSTSFSSFRIGLAGSPGAGKDGMRSPRV